MGKGASIDPVHREESQGWLEADASLLATVSSFMDGPVQG